jgi:Putative Actinobacterial Holin-X, holin superfamily III
MAAEASIFSNLSGYVDRVTKLVRLDAALLSIETKANVQSIVVAIALLLGAVAMAFLGLVILLFAAILLLIQLGVAPSLAALLVAAVLFLVAGALAFIGIERLKGWSLTPRRTLAQFNSNLQALRASLRDETNR